jgi:heptosyltransferase-2
MSVDPIAVERLVVRPPNWLGDAVLALPALAAIRAHFPKADLTIAAPASVASIFREDTDVAPNRILELPANSTAAVAALRGERFDLGILLPNSFRSAWQLWRARVPGRWGYATAGRGLLLTKRSRGGRPRSRHQSDYYRALVAGLGIACDPSAPPTLRPSTASARRADAILAERGIAASTRLIAMAPGAAYGQAKQWAPDRMAELASRLVAEHDATCVLLGASHDRDAARGIESWLRAHAPDRAARVVDLVGRTTLGALVGLAARSAVFVSNDSGGMHLAAALGRPVVAIFGPTDEEATRPVGDHDVVTSSVFCRPCMLRECPIDHRCMKRISVDTVFSAVVKRLSASSAV